LEPARASVTKYSSEIGLDLLDASDFILRSCVLVIEIINHLLHFLLGLIIDNLTLAAFLHKTLLKLLHLLLFVLNHLLSSGEVIFKVANLDLVAFLLFAEEGDFIMQRFCLNIKPAVLQCSLVQVLLHLVKLGVRVFELLLKHLDALHSCCPIIFQLDKTVVEAMQLSLQGFEIIFTVLQVRSNTLASLFRLVKAVLQIFDGTNSFDPELLVVSFDLFEFHFCHFQLLYGFVALVLNCPQIFNSSIKLILRDLYGFLELCDKFCLLIELSLHVLEVQSKGSVLVAQNPFALFITVSFSIAHSGLSLTTGSGRSDHLLPCDAAISSPRSLVVNVLFHGSETWSTRVELDAEMAPLRVSTCSDPVDWDRILLILLMPSPLLASEAFSLLSMMTSSRSLRMSSSACSLRAVSVVSRSFHIS
ncbi:hypothetical protein KCV07_g432, partial [Aureobasidium melanogenum]